MMITSWHAIFSWTPPLWSLFRGWEHPQVNPSSIDSASSASAQFPFVNFPQIQPRHKFVHPVFTNSSSRDTVPSMRIASICLEQNWKNRLTALYPCQKGFGPVCSWYLASSRRSSISIRTSCTFSENHACFRVCGIPFKPFNSFGEWELRMLMLWWIPISVSTGTITSMVKYWKCCKWKFLEIMKSESEGKRNKTKTLGSSKVFRALQVDSVRRIQTSEISIRSYVRLDPSRVTEDNSYSMHSVNMFYCVWYIPTKCCRTIQ